MTQPDTAPTSMIPSTQTVLREAFKLSPTARFFYLLQHTNTLIQMHGPYTTFPGTTVFTRGAREASRKQARANSNGDGDGALATTAITAAAPSTKELAVSLAAAQDCVGSAQLAGPAAEDLVVFTKLWEATMELLEELLTAGNLDHEAFGWGVYGLAAGYIASLSSSSSLCEEQQGFQSQKARLHDALLALPSLSSPERKREELVVKGERRVEVLVKARRQVHICASLLVQQFRREDWARVRWGHGVKVAERWAEQLALATEG